MEKMLLTEALELGAYLDLEQFAFLADNGDTIVPAQASQEIPTPTSFQTDDLDAFDSDCDDVPLAKAVLMANLFSYDLDVLLEKVPALHDGNTIVKKHVTLSVNNSEETFKLAKEGVSSSTEASISKPKSNTKKHKISQTSCSNKKTNKVEAHPRIAKSSLNNTNHDSTTVCNENVKHSVLNANSKLVCVTCHECMFDAIHDICVSSYLNDVNARVKSKSMKSRFAKSKKRKCGNLLIVQIVLWYLDSGCSKHMIGQRSQLINFVSKFLGTVRYVNNQIAKIMSYGDYQLRNVTILRVYYVEGIGHNLFSIGQFCNSDLEVSFRKHTCYVWNLDGDDLLYGSKDINLYTISLDDMLKSSPICLLSKASKTKSWLWHRQLSHLNFGTLNQLVKQGLVRGLPKLKSKKDHLCSACSLGKSKMSSHKPKVNDTNQEKLYLLHMDLYGPIRVESIN
nr:copia protein [Tanacetum cinerariifolium]